MIRRPCRLLLSSVVALLLAGCAGGPDYAGGPSEDEPHAIVDPGVDVNLWAVDGHAPSTRIGPVRIAPGRRVLKLRIEADIEDETPTPYEYREVPLYAEKGMLYTIDRKPSQRPPWELDIRQLPFE